MNPGEGSNSGYVQRGMLLREQRRYAEAEGFFRDALAQNPNDAFALMQLAGCQLQLPDRAKDALASIDRALAIEPNDAIYHGMRAYILCRLDHPADALQSARDGIAISPDSAFIFTAEAQAFLLMEKWAEAETAARQALSFDADNSTAANQLAQALRLQNKMAENAGQISGMLARDPEDAQTHCSAGWAALQRGERQVAETHFLEALRLDPDSENARNGLLNSFRARSPLYRAYLAYSFRMQRLSRGARWGVIVGLYIAMRFSREIFTGTLAPVGIAIGVLYALFVLWVWIAKGVGNFILMFDRVAKHALRRNEKIEACFVGGGITVGLLLLLIGFALQQESLFIPGVALVATAFPFSMTFTNSSKLGTYLFGAIGFTGLLAFVSLLLAAAIKNDTLGDISLILFTIGAGGAVVSTWLGNIRKLRE